MGYFQLLFLLSFLLLALFVCYKSSKRILLTPEFCFVACFIPQVVYSLGFVEKWEINFSIETILVYMGGILLYIIASIISRIVLARTVSAQYRIVCNEPTPNNKISNIRLLLFIIIQIASLLVVIRELFSLTNSRNLATAISVYTINNKANGMAMRGIAGKLNMLCYTSGYIWIYYLADTIIFKRNGNKILIICNLALSFVHQLMSGSRGGVLEVIISGFIYFWFFYEMRKQWRGKIKFKHIIWTIAICGIALFSFQAVLPYLGRTTASKASDYIGVYLSAELKNLDIMIKNGQIGPNPIENWQTITRLLNFFRRIFSITGGEQFFSIYQIVNGMNLGNVYTVFYPYINDLGYVGILFFTPIMAFFCQLSLAKAVQIRTKYFRLNMSILLYGYIITRVLFSFFSARFFEQIIQTGFLWTLFFLLLIRTFMESKFPRVRITEKIGL